MSNDPTPSAHVPRGTPLNHIETTWRRRSDPARFFFVYGQAIEAYLGAILPDANDVEDVRSDILAQMTQTGFGNYDPAQGTRFRHYLRTVVRNAARRKLRTKGDRAEVTDDVDLAAPDGPTEADLAYAEQYRKCLLDTAMRSLDRLERESGRGRLCHTVLRVVMDHPAENQQAQAARVAALTGSPMTHAAFRQQLTRARKLLSTALMAAARKTLDRGGDDEAMEELRDVGLWAYVRDHLGGEG